MTIEAILREVIRNFSTRRKYSFKPEDIEPYDTFYSEIYRQLDNKIVSL